MHDEGGFVAWSDGGRKTGWTQEAVSTVGDTDSWNIYVGTEGTLLEIFDHLPSKGTLPKMSGCLQSGWCGNSWDVEYCSLQRP